MTQLLLWITLALTAVVVVVLVAYLVGIIIALAQARASLARLATGLVAVRDQTQPLSEHMQAINRDLSALLQGLLGVNGHLAAIVGVAGSLQAGNRDDSTRAAS